MKQSEVIEYKGLLAGAVEVGKYLLAAGAEVSRVENTVDTFVGDDQEIEEWDLTGLNETLVPIIPVKEISVERLGCKNKEELKHALKQEATKLYEAKEAEFPNAELIRELERVFLLKVIDRKWMNHIDDMDQLRQGIGLQAYGQRDPLV